MDVRLVDGTYELFRHYYALPPARDRDGREVAADIIEKAKLSKDSR